MLVNSEKTDLRILRTRRLIVLAFNELMNEKGFDAISVQDIATRAMINRSTFYSHFTDKYDLFGFIIRGSFVDYLKAHLPEEPSFSINDIKLLATAVFDFVGNLSSTCHKHQPEHCRPIIESQVQSQLYELLLERLTKSNSQNFSTEPESVASMISWLMFGAGLQWNKPDTPLAKSIIINDVSQMILQYMNQLASEQAPA